MLTQEIVLPSGLIALLFLVGMAMLLVPRVRGRACIPLGVAGLFYLVFSNGLTAVLLTSPLEYAYPSMRQPEQHPEVMTIVVLTAYATEDRYMPESSLLNSSAAFRVLEAAHLFEKRPDASIIVSGTQPAADIMARQLRVLGVPSSRIEVDGNSPDTSDIAATIKALVGQKPVFLVTSAGHMTRAVGVLRKRGVNPVPAPTDYLLPRHIRNVHWNPSAIHLAASDLAVHEYLALAWYKLTDRI